MKSKFQTLNLAIEFAQRCESLHLKLHLKNQLLRASSSVALNISEGNGRFTPNDRRRIFRIAYGSLKESITILQIAKVKDPKLLDLADHIGGSLYKLCR